MHCRWSVQSHVTPSVCVSSRAMKVCRPSALLLDSNSSSNPVTRNQLALCRLDIESRLSLRELLHVASGWLARLRVLLFCFCRIPRGCMGNVACTLVELSPNVQCPIGTLVNQLQHPLQCSSNNVGKQGAAGRLLTAFVRKLESSGNHRLSARQPAGSMANPNILNENVQMVRLARL